MAEQAFDPAKFLKETAPAASEDFNPKKFLDETAEAKPMSGLDAAMIKGSEGATLGLRPVVAGLGAAAGNISGQLEGGKGVNWGDAGNAFMEGRAGANAEQNQAAEEHPYISAGANTAGSLMTLPFLPAKGIAGAARLGAGLGAARAAGSANSVGEAAGDIALGTGLGFGTAAATSGLKNAGAAILDSNAGNAILSKVEHVFGKSENPITNHVIDGLEAYKSNFQFPKESVIEKQLNGLISRIKRTPPSQWLEKDVKAITDRLGPNSIQESLQTGAERLSDIAGVISSKSSNAMSGALDKYGPVLQKGASLAGGAVGMVMPDGGPADAYIGYNVASKAFSPESLKMVGNAISSTPRVAQKLADTFGINPLTQEGITRILQTPEAKDMLLHGLLEDKTSKGPKMSTTIKPMASYK